MRASYGSASQAEVDPKASSFAILSVSSSPVVGANVLSIPDPLLGHLTSRAAVIRPESDAHIARVVIEIVPICSRAVVASFIPVFDDWSIVLDGNPRVVAGHDVTIDRAYHASIWTFRDRCRIKDLVAHAGTISTWVLGGSIV